MNEETDIRHRQLGDPRDFLVAESVLKFEPHDFLLVRWQLSDHLNKFLVRLGGFERAAGPRLGGRDALHFSVFEAFHPALLAQDVERPMTANGEEPFHRVSIDRLRRLRHEFDERVLDDIARSFDIAAEQARGIADEWSLLLHENAWQKTSLFMSVIPRSRG